MVISIFTKRAKGFNVTGRIYANYSKYLQKQVKFNPVPESYRDLHRDEFDAKGNKKSRFEIFNKINDFLIQNY